MKLWKLSPIDPNSATWDSSCYKGDAIIRAEDEKEARSEAVHCFFNLVIYNGPSQETPRSPWNDSLVVQCIELENSEHSTDGPAELIEPNLQDC
jgi:hypothetical protein